MHPQAPIRMRGLPRKLSGAWLILAVRCAVRFMMIRPPPMRTEPAAHLIRVLAPASPPGHCATGISPPSPLRSPTQISSSTRQAEPALPPEVSMRRACAVRAIHFGRRGRGTPSTRAAHITIPLGTPHSPPLDSVSIWCVTSAATSSTLWSRRAFPPITFSCTRFRVNLLPPAASVPARRRSGLDIPKRTACWG